MKRHFWFVSALIICCCSSVGAQQTINADFDSSGAVDFADFSRLISQFGLVSDSTRFQPAVDLNQDNAIDGEDAFLFADVFGYAEPSIALAERTVNLTVSTGQNTNGRVELDPMDNGFLVYLNDVSGIGGYRIVLSMPDSVKVRSVEDHFGIGLLPIKRTRSGVEIVGLVLGNRNLDRTGLLAGLTFTGDTTGVSIASVSLRGKRVSLGNQLYLGDRNTIPTANIKRVPLGDLIVRERYFDFGEVLLGDTRKRSFDIVNTFNTQQQLGATRKLPFQIELSSSDLTVDPHTFGVLSDSTTGLIEGGTKNVQLTFTPTQAGIFRGVLSVKTNRSERPVVRVHVRADVRSMALGTRVRALANFDTLKSVDYGDFDELVTRFGTVPDSAKFDLDGNGVVGGDDAFLFADLLGGFEGRASYDTVRVISGPNSSSAVRVERAGEEMTVSVRDLAKFGGYRLNLSYDKDAVDVRWAKDLAGGGTMPIHRTANGAEVVGMGFGGLIETPSDFTLARLSIRPLKGQENAASLVTVTGVVFRGGLGERDSVGVSHVGANGLDASPRILDFGPLRIGATAQKTFRVYNLNATSTAFQIVSADSAVTTSPRSVGNLGGGRTWDVTVTYRSTSAGPFASSLSLSSEEGDPSPIQIGIKAFGTVVNVVPDSLIFPDTFVGQHAKLSTTITNPDLEAFEIRDLIFSRTDTAFVVEDKPTLPLSVGPEGGTQAFSIRFNSFAQGTVLDTLRIVGSDTSFVVPIRGIGLRRRASLVTDVLEFGDVDVGKDSTHSFIIQNLGNVPFVVDSLQVGQNDTSFAFAGVTTYPDTLSVGGVDTVLVRFRPDTIGAKTDSMRVFGSDTTLVVALSGRGLPRPIIDDPLEDVVIVTFGGTITKSRNEIHFGKVPWGETDSAKVRVQNRRSGNITLRFSATGSQVTVKPDSVENLPPNQEWDVVIKFQPVHSVQTTSGFQISTNDVGDGVTSIILKSGGSNPVLSDSLLSFGKVGIGNRFDKTVTLTNTGNSRLVLDSLALGPDSNFVLVTPPTLPLSIAAAGGSQSFQVRFQPKERGTFVDRLRFSGLDTTISLPLSGSGRESKLVLAPDRIVFGLLRVGQIDTQRLTLTNSGSDTVVVDSLRLVGSATPFTLSVTPTSPDTLIPGGLREFDVVFAPLVAGAFRDTFQVISGGDTVRAPIVGTGTVARATITRLSLPFGDVAVGRSRLDTISISNAGNVPIATERVFLRHGNRGFAVINAPTDTLAVNGLIRYITRFRPDTTGSVTDTLHVEMVDTTFAVALSGSGTPSLVLTRTDNGITFSPNQLDFGNLSDGETARRIVRVTNSASTAWSFTTEIEEQGLSISPGSFSGLPTDQSWELATVWTPIDGGSKLTALNFITGTSLRVPVGRNGAFMTLLSDSLSYGSLRLGTDSTSVLRVRNRGQGEVQLQSVSIGGQTGFTLISPPALPLSLAENDSLRLRVKFEPQVAGDVVDTVRLVFADTAFAVPVKGRGIQSVISLNRTTLDFGQVTSNTDSTQLVIIQNIGNGSFVLDSLKLGSESSAFVITTSPTTPDSILGGGDADTVAIRFRPPDLGDYSGRLLFYGDKREWVVPLLGKSTQTGASVSGAVIAFGPTVSRSDSVLSFGAIPFGATRRLSFVIENNRDSTLAFSVGSTDAQVQVESISDNTLLPNQNATVTVAFSPVVGGVTATDLNILTNASSDGTVNIRVKKDPAPVSVSPLALNFDPVLVGQSDTLKTTILNPQALNFAVSQLSFAGNQAFSLFEGPALPDTVSANGGRRSLTVQFAPTTRASFSDTLLITGNSLSFKVVLSGQGLLAVVESSVDSLVFGDLDVGADSVQSFTVRNTGDVGLALGSVSATGPFFTVTDTSSLPDTLAVGQSQTFGVRYAPTSGGEHTGEIQVTLGTQVVTVVLGGFGVAPPRTTAGPFALDLDSELGDQAVRDGTVNRRTFDIDLAVTESALGTLGFNLVLQFDTTKVAFSEFVTRDLYDGATDIVSSHADSVNFSVVFLGGVSAPREVGSAGLATFTLLVGVDSADVQIVRASFANADGPVPIEIGSEGAQVRVIGSSEPNADFDGDGEVGFTDFILFAGKFGTEVGDDGYDPAFDLSGNGPVDFSDFIIFANQFGTKTGKMVFTKPASK